MPVAKVRGLELHYEILGDRGPFIALQPGGRRGAVSVKPLGEKIAEAGYRVIVYDRRNTGASTVRIEGDSENDVWADDLYALLGHLDALPAYIGGSSSGCRLAMILALRRPEAVRGLLLWRVTGGAHAAERLYNQYYGAHIAAAKAGGMAAVCEMEHWKEVIAANPKSRDALMAMNPQDFMARMERWGESFRAGSDHPVIGLSRAELRSITMPACIVPGKDPVHPLPAGQAAHRTMPNATYAEVVTDEQLTIEDAFADWDRREGLLAATFIDFLRRQR